MNAGKQLPSMTTMLPFSSIIYLLCNISEWVNNTTEPRQHILIFLLTYLSTATAWTALPMLETARCDWHTYKHIQNKWKKKSGHVLVTITPSPGPEFSISTQVSVVHIKIFVKSYKEIILGLHKKNIICSKALKKYQKVKLRKKNPPISQEVMANAFNFRTWEANLWVQGHPGLQSEF